MCTSRILAVAAVIVLSGCGTYSMPATARLSDGQTLTGTTTASFSEGVFALSDSSSGLSCSGNYDQFSTAIQLSAPVACTDGRTGVADITRTTDLMAGTGDLRLSDGTVGRVGFGRLAASVIVPPSQTYSSAALPTVPSASSSSSSGTYTGNCMYPDDLDAAGRRCGARSAYSRPGGYEPSYRPSSTYSASSGGGSVAVRGYYRKNGTYVRPHTRRR